MDVLKMRRVSGLNQTEFWSRVKVKQSGGCRYERGRRVPQTVQTLLTLAYGRHGEAHRLFADLRRK